jgi:hypothetical protein
MIRRRDLLAYLIGAGVAGTLLVGPYMLRSTVIQLVGGKAMEPPFFLLPIVWGLWNLLWARWQPAMGIGAWGALLGLVLAVSVNLLFAAQGIWFPAVLLLPVFLPVLYYLVWLLVVGPLNGALGVEGKARAVNGDPAAHPNARVRP